MNNSKNNKKIKNNNNNNKNNNNTNNCNNINNCNNCNNNSNNYNNNNDNNIDNIFPCQLIELNLSCFGCCGRNFKSKKDIYEDIKNNTNRFNNIKHKSIINLLKFRDSFSKNPDDLCKSGVCANLVQFKNIIACPLHPKINKLINKKKFLFPTKKDLRINHCDINYECETLIFWNLFNKKTKLRFIKWVSRKKYSNYDYSIGNIEGEIIKEFMNDEGIKIINC